MQRIKYVICKTIFLSATFSKISALIIYPLTTSKDSQMCSS